MYSIINNHDPFEVIILFLFIFVSYLIKSGFLHKNANKKKIVWDGFISTMQGFSYRIMEEWNTIWSRTGSADGFMWPYIR
jgi:hypothetical protein